MSKHAVIKKCAVSFWAGLYKQGNGGFDRGDGFERRA